MAAPPAGRLVRSSSIDDLRPTAPPYHVVDRDNSETQSNLYENTSEAVHQLPTIRLDNPTPQQRGRIEFSKFGGNSEESIGEWFMDYELMASCFKWDKDYMKNMLSFYMTGVAKRFVDSIRMDEETGKKVDYDEIKNMIMKRFGPERGSIMGFLKATSLKFRYTEDLNHYWEEKKRLLRIADDQVRPTTAINAMVYGLPPKLKEMVLQQMVTLEMSGTPLESLDQLYSVVNSCLQIRQELDSTRNDPFEQRSKPQNIGGFNQNRNNNNRGYNNNRTNFRGNNFNERRNNSDRNTAYNNNYTRNDRSYQNQRTNQIVRSNEGQGVNNSSRNAPPQNKDNRPNYTRTPSGEPICYICGGVGHTQYRCPKKASSGTQLKQGN
jgi:hypothetical protein